MQKLRFDNYNLFAIIILYKRDANDTQNVMK